MAAGDDIQDNKLRDLLIDRMREAGIDGQKHTSFLSEEYCRQLNSVGKTEKGVLERGLASKTFAEVLKMNHKVRGMKR